MMTAREIYEVIKANERKFRCFGIRACNETLNVGETASDSYNWDDEKEESEWERLNGACATGFDYLWLVDEPEESDIADDVATIQKAMDINARYYGAHTYLIAGMNSEYGNDEAEEIIENATVLAIIK